MPVEVITALVSRVDGPLKYFTMSEMFQVLHGVQLTYGLSLSTDQRIKIVGHQTTAVHGGAERTQHGADQCPQSPLAGRWKHMTSQTILRTL